MSISLNKNNYKKENEKMKKNSKYSWGMDLLIDIVVTNCQVKLSWYINNYVQECRTWGVLSGSWCFYFINWVIACLRIIYGGTIIDILYQALLSEYRRYELYKIISKTSKYYLEKTIISSSTLIYTS